MNTELVDRAVGVRIENHLSEVPENRKYLFGAFMELEKVLGGGGEVEHMAAGCVNRSMVPACGNCDERGHFMRKCPKGKIVR